MFVLVWQASERDGRSLRERSIEVNHEADFSRSRLIDESRGFVIILDFVDV